MDISTIIAICVLALFTIVYLVSFGVIFAYIKRLYLVGENDEEVEQAIHDDYRKYMKRYDPDEPQTFLEYKDNKRQNRHFNSIALNIVDWVISIFCIAVVSFAIVLRYQGQQLFIGDVSLFVVETGSMATINNNNDYIYENDLDGDQIPEKSLITIRRLQDEDEMELYQIYAFQVEDETIIHRLISIDEDDEGNITYTFKGDANAGTLERETDITFDQIVGVYTGFNNQALGTIIIFLQSMTGLIATFFAIIVLLGYDMFHNIAVKAFHERYDFLAFDAKRIFEKIEDVKNNRIVNATLLHKLRDKNVKACTYVRTLVRNKYYPVGSQAIILEVLDSGKKTKVLTTDAKHPAILEYNLNDLEVIENPFTCEASK